MNGRGHFNKGEATTQTHFFFSISTKIQQYKTLLGTIAVQVYGVISCDAWAPRIHSNARVGLIYVILLILLTQLLLGKIVQIAAALNLHCLHKSQFVINTIWKCVPKTFLDRQQLQKHKSQNYIYQKYLIKITVIGGKCLTDGKYVSASFVIPTGKKKLRKTKQDSAKKKQIFRPN